MKKLITAEVRKAAIERVSRLQLGTLGRLNINGETSDIVVSPSSSGIYYYLVIGFISNNILDCLIGFEYYKK